MFLFLFSFLHYSRFVQEAGIRCAWLNEDRQAPSTLGVEQARHSWATVLKAHTLELEKKEEERMC